MSWVVVVLVVEEATVALDSVNERVPVLPELGIANSINLPFISVVLLSTCPFDKVIKLANVLFV